MLQRVTTWGPWFLHILQLRSYRAFCPEHRILRHICTHLGEEKSSVKTWIRIWWAHRERWNASACSVPAQCKQPAHVCACLPPLKLLSISLRCPFLLIQTFVPPATTDAIPPQDFLYKHSIQIPCLQPSPQTVQLSSPSGCREAAWALGKSHTYRIKVCQKSFYILWHFKTDEEIDRQMEQLCFIINLTPYPNPISLDSKRLITRSMSNTIAYIF